MQKTEDRKVLPRKAHEDATPRTLCAHIEERGREEEEEGTAEDEDNKGSEKPANE